MDNAGKKFPMGVCGGITAYKLSKSNIKLVYLPLTIISFLLTVGTDTTL